WGLTGPPVRRRPSCRSRTTSAGSPRRCQQGSARPRRPSCRSRTISAGTPRRCERGHGSRSGARA
ncbi:MAG: hypothetical protein AVDCRST_MAG20-2615, partial [uncultured Acidimicrobiales bacterium]